MVFDYDYDYYQKDCYVDSHRGSYSRCQCLHNTDSYVLLVIIEDLLDFGTLEASGFGYLWVVMRLVGFRGLGAFGQTPAMGVVLSGGP